MLFFFFWKPGYLRHTKSTRNIGFIRLGQMTIPFRLKAHLIPTDDCMLQCRYIEPIPPTAPSSPRIRLQFVARIFRSTGPAALRIPDQPSLSSSAPPMALGAGIRHAAFESSTQVGDHYVTVITESTYSNLVYDSPEHRSDPSSLNAKLMRRDIRGRNVWEDGGIINSESPSYK